MMYTLMLICRALPDRILPPAQVDESQRYAFGNNRIAERHHHRSDDHRRRLRWVKHNDTNGLSASIQVDSAPGTRRATVRPTLSALKAAGCSSRKNCRRGNDGS